MKKEININKFNSPWENLGRPMLIAEIGGNHEGSFTKALDLLDLALESEADVVKFQIYFADSLVSKKESPKRYNHFKKFELTIDQHIELNYPKENFVESYRRYAKSLIVINGTSGRDKKTGLLFEFVLMPNVPINADFFLFNFKIW